MPCRGGPDPGADRRPGAGPAGADGVGRAGRRRAVPAGHGGAAGRAGAGMGGAGRLRVAADRVVAVRRGAPGQGDRVAGERAAGRAGGVVAPVGADAGRARARVVLHGCGRGARGPRAGAVLRSRLARAVPRRRAGRVVLRLGADAGRARAGLVRARTALVRQGSGVVPGQGGDGCRHGAVLDGPNPAGPARPRRVGVGAGAGRPGARGHRAGGPGRARARLAGRRSGLACRGTGPGRPVPVDRRRAGALGVPECAHAGGARRAGHRPAAPRRGRARCPAGRPAGAPLGPAVVRQARADLRRTLFGEPVRVRPVDRREPSGAQPRTLEKRT